MPAVGRSGLPLLNRLGIRDWAARGLAMGAPSHGFGGGSASVNDKE